MKQSVVEPVSREDFAEFVMNMRTAARITQKRLGELLGTNQSAINKWETGAYMPRETDVAIKRIREVVRSEIQLRRALET